MPSHNSNNQVGISHHQPQPSWGGNQHPSNLLSASQQMLNQTPEQIRKEAEEVARRIAREARELARVQGVAVVGIAANAMSSTLPGMGTTNFLVNAGTKASSVLGSLGVPGI